MTKIQFLQFYSITKTSSYSAPVFNLTSSMVFPFFFFSFWFIVCSFGFLFILYDIMSYNSNCCYNSTFSILILFLAFSFWPCICLCFSVFIAFHSGNASYYESKLVKKKVRFLCKETTMHEKRKRKKGCYNPYIYLYSYGVSCWLLHNSEPTVNFCHRKKRKQR